MPRLLSSLTFLVVALAATNLDDKALGDPVSCDGVAQGEVRAGLDAEAIDDDDTELLGQVVEQQARAPRGLKIGRKGGQGPRGGGEREGQEGQPEVGGNPPPLAHGVVGADNARGHRAGHAPRSKRHEGEQGGRGCI